MQEAKFYTKIADKRVECHLCPNSCIIKDGQKGICSIRQNIGGKLFLTTHHKYTAIGFDPIEKKPLYHFFPGKSVLSVGSLGCNMHCEWCQNCDISQPDNISSENLKNLSASELLEKALIYSENIGIAYTYNEPGISFETNIETAKLFHNQGLKNIMVTNGYINSEALSELLKYTDAINLDIKSFNAAIYKKYTGARLENVLKNAKSMFASKTHLELTYLVVNGINDQLDEFEDFICWVKKELSADIPLHISRYFPRNNYLAPATPLDILKRFGKLASRELNYVYLGNIIDKEFTDTYCKQCKSLIIERMGYTTDMVGAGEDGCCLNCGEKVFISA
jgi:pyruvate formate lyase activating enzyme